ncbi:MAG: LPS assembly lipoprotein LptE [Roseobacter sp.]
MLLFSKRAILFLPLALAACGFTPVYSTGGTGSALQNRMQVVEPDTRDAFFVTRRVEERLGRTADPAYVLSLIVTSREEDLAVDREGTSTRFNILGEAEFALVEQSTGRVVTSGSVDNFTGYSATGTTIATLAAERDAQQRLMILLADQIVTRLLSTDLS